MDKIKLGKWEIDETELEQQHRDAVQRGAERVRTEPQAHAITYDAASQRLVIELKNGVIFSLPRSLVQGLSDAAPEAIATARLGPRGASVHWDTLDLDFSLAGLIAGVFGTPAWLVELGRRGGQVTSEAKAAAARANGQKGGRPSQPKVEQSD